MNTQNIQFQTALLSWYDAHARILPWRDKPTPYWVWISEIMLQQTRVDAVKPYFERFIKELPTVEDLAHAEDERLVKLWEGLGYYNRARNLKKAAQIVVEQYGGKLPSEPETLIKLPGIGRYSAGAIASIAYGVRVSAVDGNVLRVFARLTSNRGDITAKEVKEQITKIVDSILPAERVGDFNQALMELGATVCLPNGAPRCDSCPVDFLCKANKGQLTDQIPVKTKKAARKKLYKTVFLLACNDRVAVAKRPDEGLLPGLWELPNTESHLTIKQCEETLKEWGVRVVSINTLSAAKHIFTHVEWHMVGYLILVENCIGLENWVWITPEELTNVYTIPTAFRAYIKVIPEGIRVEKV